MTPRSVRGAAAGYRYSGRAMPRSATLAVVAGWPARHSSTRTGHVGVDEEAPAFRGPDEIDEVVLGHDRPRIEDIADRRPHEAKAAVAGASMGGHGADGGPVASTMTVGVPEMTR